MAVSRSSWRVLQTISPLQFARLRYIPIRQPTAYSCPGDFELRFAILQIGVLAAIAAERRLAVHIAAPPPLIDMSREAGALPDPANRLAAPDHCVVVGVGLPVDLGDVNSEGFVVEHRSHTRVTRLTHVACNATVTDNLSDLRCEGPIRGCWPRFVRLNAAKDVGPVFRHESTYCLIQGSGWNHGGPNRVGELGVT
jgi:hypothetical protein